MTVKGRLKDMGLADIVYILHAERKTAVVHLGSDLGYGRVYLKEGEIVHATYRKYSGVEAMFHLLAWQDAEFEVEGDAQIPAQTIHMPVESLLLEGLKRLDESRSEKREIRGGYPGDMESMKLIETLLQKGILEKIGGEIVDGGR